MKTIMRKVIVTSAVIVCCVIAGKYLYLSVFENVKKVLVKENAVVSNLADSLKAGDISKIEVFYIPLTTESPLRLTQAMVFTQPALVIYKNTKEADGLYRTLKKTRLTPIGLYEPDLRLGLIGYDTVGKEIARLSIDASNNGYVNGVPCHFKGNLKKDIVNLVDPFRTKGSGLAQKFFDFVLTNK